MELTEIRTIKIEGEGMKAFYEDESDVDREIEADMCYP